LTRRESKPAVAQVVGQGTIQAQLPRGLYRVRFDDGRIVTATIGRELRRVLVRVIPGDRVLVEASEVDPTRGRIIEKQK